MNFETAILTICGFGITLSLFFELIGLDPWLTLIPTCLFGIYMCRKIVK